MAYRDEINAANRAGKSRRERWDLRAAVREKYGMGEEKRQRGGVAGVYDRNKDYIVPIASGVAGLATGGILAPALIGAGMRGLDREGKSGIGFDVGQGLRGGLEGAAYGSAANLAKGGINALRGAFVPGGAAGASAGVPGALPPGIDLTNAANANVAATGGGASRNVLTKALDFAKANPNAVGMAAQGAGAALNASATRDMTRQQLALNERQYRDEEERRKRIAELLAPLYGQMQGGNRPSMPTPGLPRLGV